MLCVARKLSEASIKRSGSVTAPRETSLTVGIGSDDSLRAAYCDDPLTGGSEDSHKAVVTRMCDGPLTASAEIGGITAPLGANDHCSRCNL